MNRFCRTISRKVLLGLLVIFCNAVLLYLVKDVVNEYANMMYVHFDFDGSSTRDNLWLKDNDFFTKRHEGCLSHFSVLRFLR